MDLRGLRLCLVAAILSVLAATTGLTIGAPAVQAAGNRTVVTLTFDDGEADQYPAQQTMAAHDLVGTFYVTSGWVDRAGYLTRDQLKAMAEDGNEIGGHTVTHPDLTGMPLPEVRAEICNGRSVLEDWGFRPANFAYPFGLANPEVQQVAAQCGYITSRGLGDVETHDSCGGCHHAESMPPGNPQYLKAPAQIESSWTLDHLKATVTNAVQRGGGWVALTFHRICARPGTGTCPVGPSTPPAVFDAFAAWLDSFRDDAANNTVVQTVDQTVRQYMGSSYAYQPATEAPPRPPAPMGVNALANPSLESPDPRTGFPACWQPSGWGRKKTEWATVSPGRTGGVAQQVRITDYVNGDAKLLPTNDLQTCSPTVEPGKRYELSVWYRSAGRAQFALYLRDESHEWTNWMSGPWLEPPAASSTWTRATFVTPTIPEGRTGLSFGLAFASAGTHTTDDYSLSETDRPTTQAVSTASVDGEPSILRSPFTWLLAVVLLLLAALFRSSGHDDGAETRRPPTRADLDSTP